VLRAASAPRKSGTAIGNSSSDEQGGKRASINFFIRRFNDLTFQQNLWPTKSLGDGGTRRQLGSVSLRIVTARINRFMTR
jgi:hypothetical protein